MKTYKDIFKSIISLENLFNAWELFKKHKGKREDVQEFGFGLEQNIFDLHDKLISGKYKHSLYKPFCIQDPKLRLIHKATVKDRIVHQAIYTILNPIFERSYIANSFSCRIGKGTHKGVLVLEQILRRVSRNNQRQCYALKCDIRKYFDNIDHKILIRILENKIKDFKAIQLLNEIISSFSTNNFHSCGLPIGNLTSQLFANIYLNEFDQFLKHKLKVKNYVRYTDDFVVVSEDKKYLQDLIILMSKFLNDMLKISLHPSKLTIRRYRQGIDFLGYIVFPYHILPRTKTKKRMFRRLENKATEVKKGKVSEESYNQTIQSYLGYLKHADTYFLRKKIKEIANLK